jgi:hypothetical protein
MSSKRELVHGILSRCVDGYINLVLAQRLPRPRGHGRFSSAEDWSKYGVPCQEVDFCNSRDDRPGITDLISKLLP